MKFFTDKSVKNDYLLVKIQDYLKMKDFSQWKEVFIDPGVYELAKSNSYSWENKINIREFLNSLPENHYFSADYPCDMLEFRKNIDNHLKGILTDGFLIKSWDNAVKYCNHPQYIITVQSRFKDYSDFIRWFDKYNNLYLEYGSQIIGLGNSCRIHSLSSFIKKSLEYAFGNCNYPRIHIYGLSMRIIPYAYRLCKATNTKLSMDSTKWTRPVSSKLKQKFGAKSCNSENRQLFFDEYMKIVKNKLEKEDLQKLLTSYGKNENKRIM